MTEAERGLYLDASAILATVAHMLTKNDWRLIAAEDLARRVALALASPPKPDGAAQPAGPDRPWRQHYRGGAGRARIADPVADAAIRIYSETLYGAFADRDDADRQQRAYYELHRYARRAAARFGADLSRDEHEDVASHVLTELYCRYLAGQSPPEPDAAGVAGVFMAITLQQVRNAVRMWRAKIGAWVALESDEDGPDHTAHPRQLRDPWDSSDPVIQAEQRERREQVARIFQLATERYPRARVQLRAVWLHIMEDRSYAAVASILNLTVTHVRLLTWRGLRRLNGDPGFRVYAQDALLLDGQRATARASVDQERKLGNE
jgi:hypothetical protein